MHKNQIDLVDNRNDSALEENQVLLAKDSLDVLIIGHGSKDPNAKISIDYSIDGLRNSHRRDQIYFIEIQEKIREQ